MFAVLKSCLGNDVVSLRVCNTIILSGTQTKTLEKSAANLKFQVNLKYH